MSIPINNILRSATRQDTDPLNIMWFPYNGIFETLLLPNFPHKFYGAHDVEYMKWDLDLYPKPNNFYTLPAHNNFSMDLEIDLIVCNNRLLQFDRAATLSQVLHVPLLLIEHTLPLSVMKQEDIFIVKNNKQPNLCMVCDELINQTWQASYPIINYGVPNLYDDTISKKPQIALIGNFLKEDYGQIEHIITKSPIPVKIIGNNPGLSSIGTPQEVIHILKESLYYLNIAPKNTMPLMLLMAMSCGCIPISNGTNFIQNLIKQYGYIFENVEKLIEILQEINITDNDKDLSLRISQTTTQQFDFTTFINNWKNIFNQIYSYVYMR